MDRKKDYSKMPEKELLLREKNYQSKRIKISTLLAICISFFSLFTALSSKSFDLMINDSAKYDQLLVDTAIKVGTTNYTEEDKEEFYNDFNKMYNLFSDKNISRQKEVEQYYNSYVMNLVFIITLIIFIAFGYNYYINRNLEKIYSAISQK